MGKIGELDASAAALGKRLQAQDRGAQHDLNSWIFSIIKPVEGERCLDLGCGLGKQALPLAAAVGPRGGVTAVDVSVDALADLAKSAKTLTGAAPITCLQAALDNVPAAMPMAPFDLIHSAYAIYYVDDAEKLFERLLALAAPGARLFFSGPGAGNNTALLDLARQAGVEKASGPRPAADFMEDTAPAIWRRLAGDNCVSMHRLENPVVFDTAEDLYSYWSNHNLYSAAAQPRFRRLAEDHVQRHNGFVNTKQVVGLLVSL